MLEHDRYGAFGADLDALKKRTFAEVGDEDVKYVKSLDRFSVAICVGNSRVTSISAPLRYCQTCNGAAEKT